MQGLEVKFPGDKEGEELVESLWRDADERYKKADALLLLMQMRSCF